MSYGRRSQNKRAASHHSKIFAAPHFNYWPSRSQSNKIELAPSKARRNIKSISRVDKDKIFSSGFHHRWNSSNIVVSAAPANWDLRNPFYYSQSPFSLQRWNNTRENQAPWKHFWWFSRGVGRDRNAWKRCEEKSRERSSHTRGSTAHTAS